MIDPIFWLVAVLAIFFVGLSKSGLVASLGVVGVPMLSLVMPPKEAAGMMLPLLLVMDAVAVWNYRRDADWKILSIMLPGAIIGICIGWMLWSVVSEDFILLLIGLISLAFVLDAVFKVRKRLITKPSSPYWGTFWGGISGFTSFVSHTGGPPFQIYTLPRKLPPQKLAGTSAWFFGIVNTLKLIPFFFLGQLSVNNLEHDLVLFPVAVAGILFGIYLVRRIDTALFYKIAYALIFLLSLKLIYDGVTGLIV